MQEWSWVFSAVAMVIAIVALYYTLCDTQDANRKNIRYVRDDRTGVCLLYQYNVGMVVLECERIPVAVLEHKQ